MELWKKINGTHYYVEFGSDEGHVVVKSVARFTGADYEKELTEEAAWADVPDPESLIDIVDIYRECAYELASLYEEGI